MIKLWARTLKNHKMKKQATLSIDTDKLDYSLFFEYICSMCHEMDIPTPVIIKDHIFNFAKFNYVNFKVDDFVESIDFDLLVVENVKL